MHLSRSFSPSMSLCCFLLFVLVEGHWEHANWEVVFCVHLCIFVFSLPLSFTLCVSLCCFSMSESILVEGHWEHANGGAG